MPELTEDVLVALLAAQLRWFAPPRAAAALLERAAPGHATPDGWRRLCVDRPDVACALARDPHGNEVMLTALAAHGSRRIRRHLWLNPALPARVQGQVGRPRGTEETLEQLRAALVHPSVNPDHADAVTAVSFAAAVRGDADEARSMVREIGAWAGQADVADLRKVFTTLWEAMSEAHFPISILEALQVLEQQGEQQDVQQTPRRRPRRQRPQRPRQTVLLEALGAAVVLLVDRCEMFHDGSPASLVAVVRWACELAGTPGEDRAALRALLADLPLPQMCPPALLPLAELARELSLTEHGPQLPHIPLPRHRRADMLAVLGTARGQSRLLARYPLLTLTMPRDLIEQLARREVGWSEQDALPWAWSILTRTDVGDLPDGVTANLLRGTSVDTYAHYVLGEYAVEPSVDVLKDLAATPGSSCPAGESRWLRGEPAGPVPGLAPGEQLSVPREIPQLTSGLGRVVRSPMLDAVLDVGGTAYLSGALGDWDDPFEWPQGQIGPLEATAAPVVHRLAQLLLERFGDNARAWLLACDLALSVDALTFPDLLHVVTVLTDEPEARAGTHTPGA